MAPQKLLQELRDRYERDYGQWERDSIMWRELVSASVSKPSYDDLYMVLALVSRLTPCHTSFSGVFHADTTRTHAKPGWNGWVQRNSGWYRLPPEDPLYAHYRASGKHPEVVVARLYGKARQWLKEVVLEPPNPDTYTAPYKSPFRKGEYCTARLSEHLDTL